VPTLDEVRDKIERRYAVALGAAELAKDAPGTHLLEVQKATLDMAGAARLEEIRAALAAQPAEAIEAETPAALDAPTVDTTKPAVAAAPGKKAAPARKAPPKKAAPAAKKATEKRAAPAKKEAAKKAPPAAPDAG
jgi:hypothetical protein